MSKKSSKNKFFFTAAAVVVVCFTGSSVCYSKDDNLSKAVQLNDSATAKLRSGNLDGAEIDLLQALEYSNNNPKVKRNLGVVYYEKGSRALKTRRDFFQAERYFRNALRIDPENAVYKRGYAAALYLEANSRSKDGQSEAALGLYEKVASYDPKNVSAWVQASQQAWQMQRLDKAAEYLKKAKALNPNDKNVRILEDRLRAPKGEKDFQTAQSEHFVLSAEENYMNQMGSHQILYELEQLYNQVSYKLSFYPKQKIGVVLYPRADFHANWSLPARVSGYYDGKLRIPYSPAHPSLDLIQASVRHELTHAFIHSINPSNVPTWMTEGLAQWVEGKRMDVKMKESLVMVHVARRLPDIAHLDGIFSAQKNPYNNSDMTAVYMKSFSLIEYLIETYGIWSVIDMMKQYAVTNSVDVIFKKKFGEDSKSIDARWIKWLEQQGRIH